MRVLVSAIIMAMLVMAQNKSLLAIKDGQDALIGEFPSYVTIHLNSTHHCGGTIIEEDQILTAASCLFKDEEPIDEKSLLVVKPVDNERPGLSDIQTEGIPVVRKCIPKFYKPSRSQFDIAILKLSRPYDLWRQDLRAKLPSCPLNACNIWSVGMGSIIDPDLPHLYPEYLQKLAVKSETCGDHIHHSYLCLAKKDCPGGGVSAGDEGGGVFVREMDGTQLVVGVIAQPSDAEEPDEYDLYTNVHRLSSVIEDLQDECGPITAFGIRISAY